jgi:hypothetical protein
MQMRFLTIGLLGLALLQGGLQAQAFSPMVVGCHPDNGGFGAGFYNQGTMVNCTLMFYPCYAPPNWDVIGYIVAAPGQEWNSNDMGGLLNLCNGNPNFYNWNQQTYTVIDSNGNQVSYPYPSFAQQCNGQCNNGNFFQPYGVPFYQCSNVIYNNCSNENPEQCQWNSSMGASCYSTIGGSAGSGPMNSAIATGFKNWTIGSAALGTALSGDYVDPLDNTSTADEVGSAAEGAGDVAVEVASSFIQVVGV